MDLDYIPIVMAIGGSDPSGGAGLIADTEAIVSQGAHVAPVVSCITVQDTCDVSAVEPVPPRLLLAQARAVLEDMPVDAIKIGLLGSEENMEAVNELLNDYPDIPTVVDPVIASGNGTPLADEGQLDALRHLIVPCADVLTPNIPEVMALVPGADSVAAAVPQLRRMGCDWVLVTGTHDNTPEVINRLYGEGGEVGFWRWERLPDRYHGSGCTLASALAALLARGLSVPEAVEQAQDYTWQSLRAGYRLGMGQFHPNRMFWVDEPPEDEGEGRRG